MYTDNKLEPMEETEKQLPLTLANRLDPKVAKDLDAMATRYPTVYRYIGDALKEEHFYTSLTYDVLNYMRIYLAIDLNNLSQYFKPLDS